jgi:hypothetical protein
MVELLWVHLADGDLPLDDYVTALEQFFAFIADGGFDRQIAFTDFNPASALPARGNSPIQVLDPANFDNNVARPQRRWPFPGRLPGQPISADTLMLKLRRHGIVVSSARTAALIALATDLPAPVLAELLDLHISTAVRWVTYVKRDWTDYLAARAAEMTAAH